MIRDRLTHDGSKLANNFEELTVSGELEGDDECGKEVMGILMKLTKGSKRQMSGCGRSQW